VARDYLDVEPGDSAVGQAAAQYLKDLSCMDTEALATKWCSPNVELEVAEFLACREST